MAKIGRSVWTVEPESDQVDLDFGGLAFWVRLKRELTVGEQRRVDTAGFRGVMAKGAQEQGERAERGQGDGMEISVDWRAQSFARTEAYLVDWSLADEAGNKLPVGREAIQALRQEVYALIEDAITAHVVAQTAKKASRDGEPKPSPTSS